MVSIASAFRNRKYCMQVLNRVFLFLLEQILAPLITDKITFNSRNAKEIFQLCTKCNTMRRSMMILNYYLIWETMQQHRTRKTQKIHVFTIIYCTWLDINIQKIWWFFYWCKFQIKSPQHGRVQSQTSISKLEPDVKNYLLQMQVSL